MNNPKNHHYVPDFYLKGFASEEKVPKIINLMCDGKRITTSTKKTAMERYFYRDERFKDENIIERELSKKESEVSGILKDLANKKLNVKNDARHELAYYIALQFLRTRNMRHISVKLIQDPLYDERFINKITEKYGQESYEELIDPNNKNHPNKAHIDYMISRSPEVAMSLLDRKWIFHSFRFPLITSDSPVSWTNDQGKIKEHNKALNQSRSIFFPASRYVLIEMKKNTEYNIKNRYDLESFRNGWKDICCIGSKTLSQKININTALFSYNYIYYHPHDKNLINDDLLLKYMGKNDISKRFNTDLAVDYIISELNI